MLACLRGGRGKVNYNGRKEASCRVVKAFIEEGETQQGTTVNKVADLMTIRNSQRVLCPPQLFVWSQ